MGHPTKRNDRALFGAVGAMVGAAILVGVGTAEFGTTDLMTTTAQAAVTAANGEAPLAHAKAQPTPASIVRSPTALPQPIGDRGPETVRESYGLRHPRLLRVTWLGDGRSVVVRDGQPAILAERFGCDPHSRRRLPPLVLVAVDHPDDALDHLRGQAGRHQLARRFILLDVACDDPVEQVIIG